MKQLLLTATILTLTACSETEISYCEQSFTPVEWEKVSGVKYDVFEMCLDKVADMRSSQGGDYTTNDDEDLQHAIKECRFAASPYQYYQDECGPNPKYVAQQECCSVE